ncbi:MAG: hypothetical protein Q9165_007961 [Trypethelium subeluteriae]
MSQRAGNIEPLNRPPVVLISRDQGELRSFQYFRESTLQQMTFFFPYELWDSLVPQIAHEEPCVRHALFALSGFHERFLSSVELASDEPQFCRQQYDRALKIMRSASMSHKSLAVQLFCCIIFILLETLQGNFGTAIELFRSARKLVHDVEHDPQFRQAWSWTPTTYKKLKDAYSRLDYNATSMLGEVDPGLSNAAFVEPKHEVPPPATAFSSIEEARQHLENITCSWIRKVNDFQADHPYFMVLLGSWREAFAQFVAAHGYRFTAQDRRSRVLLEIYRRDFELILLSALDPPTPQSVSFWWDDKIGYMEDIVHFGAIAAGVAESGYASTGESAPNFFSSDSSIVICLYSVALRCRDPIIRRRAITILRSGKRQEGFWNSSVAANLAERVVMHEERGLDVRACSDVPAEARLQNLRWQSSGMALEAVLTFGSDLKRTESVRLWQSDSI